MGQFVLVILLGLGSLVATQRKEHEWIALDQPVPKGVADATLIGPKAPKDLLHLSINLPLRDAEGMKQFVDSVSNPGSPNYRQFSSPEELGARFGLASADVKKVGDYLTAQGMRVTLVSKSRQSILAECNVAQAEAAFRTTISEYSVVEPGKSEHALRFTYTKPPSLPAPIHQLVTYVGGLENFIQPRHGPVRHVIYP